jgi:hypothetical protein
MTKKSMKQELVKAIIGYHDCNDCEACQFKDCCAEEAIASDLIEAGWIKRETAQWEYFPSTGTLYRCSNCKSRVGRRTPWCGQCGAEMEGYVQ